MSIIIRLQNLPWSANSVDIRHFFSGLSIPEGGVHIVGGEMGDAFIAFSTDEDARLAMAKDGGKIKDMQIKLLLSSRTEMMRVIEQARQQNMVITQPHLVAPQPAILALQQPTRIITPTSDSERRRGRSPSPHHRSRDRSPARDRRRSPDDRRGSKRDRSRSPSRSSRSFSRDMDRRGDRFKRDDRRYDDSRYREERRSTRDSSEESKRYLDADHVNSRSQLHATEGFRNMQNVHEQMQNIAMHSMYPSFGTQQAQSSAKTFPDAFMHASGDSSLKLPQTDRIMPQKQVNIPHSVDQKPTVEYSQGQVPFRSPFESSVHSTKESSVPQTDQSVNKPRRRTRFEPEFVQPPTAPHFSAPNTDTKTAIPENQQEVPSYSGRPLHENYSKARNTWPHEMTERSENMPWNEKQESQLNPILSKNGDFLQVIPMDLDPSPSDIQEDKDIYQETVRSSTSFGRNNTPPRDDDLRRDNLRGPSHLKDKGSALLNEKRGPVIHSEGRSTVSLHSENRIPVGMQNDGRGPIRMHNEGRGPVGLQNEGRSSGMHNENRGPISMHNEDRNPISMHNENRGPISKHNENRSQLEMRSEGRGSIGRQSENRGQLDMHGEGRGSVGVHNESRGPVGRQSDGRGPIGRQNESRGPIGRQSEGRGATGGQNEGRGTAGRHDEGRNSTAGRHDESRAPTGRHNEDRGSLIYNENRGSMHSSDQGHIPPSLTVEVRGLPPDARIDDILNLFHGIPLPAANVRIEANEQGFEKAVIRFVSVGDFEEALSRNRRFMHDGQCQLVPCPAAAFDNDSRLSKIKPKPKPREEDLTIQLRGLPFSCKDNDVIRFFDGLRILDLFVEIGPNGKASGIGFVEFGTPEDFRAALAMNGKTISHRYITVSVSSKEMMAFTRGEDYEFQPKRSSGQSYPSRDHSPHHSTNQGRSLPPAGQNQPPLNQGRPPINQGRPPLNQGRPPINQGRPPINQGRPPPMNQGRAPPPCISMKGLPEGVTNRDIADFLGEVGIMPRAVHIMLRPDKTPSGDAFVEFGNPADMEAALEMNGKPMLENLVVVQPISFYEMSEILGRPGPMPPNSGPAPLLRTPGEIERPRRPLLSKGPGEGPFRERSRMEPPIRGNRPIFEPFKNRPESGRPFGPGRMRAPFPNRPFNGNRPDARFSGPPAERGFGSPGCVVSINNLHFKAGLEELLDFFHDYNISKDNIIRKFNENGQTTGEARIAFQTPRDAQRAVRELNQKSIMGRPLTLSVL